jgi:hypothetical protein
MWTRKAENRSYNSGRGNRIKMDDLIVHQVNITHYRLVELARLVDQAKPFYDWIEKHARRISGSHKSLNEILFQCSRDEIARIINACYSDNTDEKPFLFDGIDSKGRW